MGVYGGFETWRNKVDGNEQPATCMYSLIIICLIKRKVGGRDSGTGKSSLHTRREFIDVSWVCRWQTPAGVSSPARWPAGLLAVYWKLSDSRLLAGCCLFDASSSTTTTHAISFVLNLSGIYHAQGYARIIGHGNKIETRDEKWHKGVANLCQEADFSLWPSKTIITPLSAGGSRRDSNR